MDVPVGDEKANPNGFWAPAKAATRKLQGRIARVLKLPRNVSPFPKGENSRKYLHGTETRARASSGGGGGRKIQIRSVRRETDDETKANCTTLELIMPCSGI